MHIYYLLSWLLGVRKTWLDEILPSIGIARAFASSMRPKQHFDNGGLLLVN
jgi:hypothetical protein